MRQTIRDRRAITTGAVALILAACTVSGPAPDRPVPDLPGPGVPVRFVCGDRPAAVEFADEGVRLILDGRTHELSRAPSASGARYAGADESTVFWDRGDRALVTVDGQRLPECRRQSGSLYTANGAEPGWRLTIGPVRLRLEADYGQRIVETATPAPEAGPDDAAYYRAEAGGQRVTVRIVRRYCENAMSGKPFPDTVSVMLGGERLDGCGGDPATLLMGRAWRVVTLGGAQVPPSAAPTMTFAADGSVAGFDGCNRFHGRYHITGIGLEFSALATTRMACPGGGDDLARRLHDRLAEVELFRLDRDGRLLLGSHGQADGIVAVRSPADQGLSSPLAAPPRASARRILAASSARR